MSTPRGKKPIEILTIEGLEYVCNELKEQQDESAE